MGRLLNAQLCSSFDERLSDAAKNGKVKEDVDLFKKVLMALIPTALCGCASGATLEDEFRSPPHPAKPWVYWSNMDGHFTKEGITADLESMKVVGIGGWSLPVWSARCTF